MMWSGACTVTSRSPLDVVCDAGPLIHLDELGCLELLADFRAILVPRQVWLEIEQHRPEVLVCTRVVLQQVSVALSEDASFQALARALALDLGEQAALSLMTIHPGALLLTDDAAARLGAKGLGYEVHGTIGILLRAIRQRQRKPLEVLSLLRDLPSRSTLHIQHRLLQEIIGQVEGETSG